MSHGKDKDKENASERLVGAITFGNLKAVLRTTFTAYANCEVFLSSTPSIKHLSLTPWLQEFATILNMIEATLSYIAALEVCFVTLPDGPEEEKRRERLLRYSTVHHFNSVLKPPSELKELEAPLRSLCEAIALPHSEFFDRVRDVSGLLNDLQEVLIGYQVCSLADFLPVLTKKVDGAASDDLQSMLQTNSE